MGTIVKIPKKLLAFFAVFVFTGLLSSCKTKESALNVPVTYTAAYSPSLDETHISWDGVIDNSKSIYNIEGISVTFRLYNDDTFLRDSESFEYEVKVVYGKTLEAKYDFVTEGEVDKIELVSWNANYASFWDTYFWWFVGAFVVLGLVFVVSVIATIFGLDFEELFWWLEDQYWLLFFVLPALVIGGIAGAILGYWVWVLFILGTIIASIFLLLLILLIKQFIIVIFESIINLFSSSKKPINTNYDVSKTETFDETADENSYLSDEDTNSGQSYEVIKQRAKPKQKHRKANKGERLDSLIGLNKIKEELRRIEAFTIKNKGDTMSMHMVFTGNPGTGKTEVARFIADIMYKNNVLPTNKLIETDRSGLVAGYIGHTAPKTNKIIDEAMGGVLFIDEAYTLFANDSGWDVGPEAIATLLARMENDRGKFIVIMAGYEKEMRTMIASNPGLQSRFQYILNFPDYSSEELKEIAKLFLAKKKYIMEENALDLMMNSINKRRNDPSFANAREVRKFIEGIIPIQNLRSIANLADRLIIEEDVFNYIKDFIVEVEPKSAPIFGIPSKETLINNAKFSKDGQKYSNDDIKNRVVAIFNGDIESTGFLITEDGYGVTCAHCVTGATEVKIKVFLNVDGRKFTLDYNAAVVKVDEQNDVALFKVETSDPNFYYFALALNNPNLRDEIYLPGFIWGYSFLPSITIYAGMVINENEELYSIDIFGKSGQSGSPIVSKSTNQVVGVFKGSTSQMIGNSNEEINHFVPIKYVWQLLEETTKSN